MPAQENKAIARRYLEEVWSKGDFAAESDLLASNFIDHNPIPGFPPNRDGHHQTLSMFRAALPDLHFNLELLIADEHNVVDHWTATGTHRGELMGIPATGKQVTFTGTDIARIEKGKIAEIWHQEDQLGLFQQLGVALS